MLLHDPVEKPFEQQGLLLWLVRKDLEEGEAKAAIQCEHGLVDPEILGGGHMGQIAHQPRYGGSQEMQNLPVVQVLKLGAEFNLLGRFFPPMAEVPRAKESVGLMNKQTTFQKAEQRLNRLNSHTLTYYTLAGFPAVTKS